PPFTEQQLKQIVDTVENTDPAAHGLPGHNGTVRPQHHPPRLAPGRPDVEEVKKLLGKAKPQKRAAHVQELLALFTRVCAGEVILIYVDEVHVHRDLDSGYTWGRRGQRVWRRSDCPKLQERMNAYGAYDFSNGECPLWQNGWCNGE